MSWQSKVNSLLETSTAIFGEVVVYTPKDPLVIPFSVKGIFSRQYVEVGQGLVKSVSFKPILGVNLIDFEVRPKRGDQVTVREIEYLITDSQEDGEGHTNLVLNRA